MISVLIPTHDDEERLARMLAGLVRAAVDGMVSEVIVFDAGSGDSTRQVAEFAGCRFVAQADRSLRQVIEETRSDWLLVLAPGARLAEGWGEAVLAHVNAPAGAAGAAQFRLVDDGQRPLWKRVLFPQTAKGRFARGLLISRRQALATLGGNATIDRLGNGLALSSLRAGIFAEPS